MDTNVLVSEGSQLVKILDTSVIKPRAALWVYNAERDRWRLWIVPAKGIVDKKEFYRKLAELITQNRDRLPNLDISDVELQRSDHPAVSALGKTMQVPGLVSVHMSGNRLNGYYLPDGIILRMAV